MEWLSDPNLWLGLATLVVLEIVLGIDNLVFIAILADKLPPEQRDKARLTGLALALLMRVGLLFALSWIMGLVEPLFALFGRPFSWRDLILLAGGLFLLGKATMELHERLEGDARHGSGQRAHAGFGLVIVQIVVLDAVFSLDSVITAVGMVDELPVMITAVIIAVGLMMLASKPLTAFVGRHPTVVVLCLGFLLMIGFALVAEGLGFKIPKGYLYAAIAFSIGVEAFNQLSRRRQEKRLRRLPLRQRTADSVLRLLGARPLAADAAPGDSAPAPAASGLQAAEHDMIHSVLGLAGRSVASVMTVRGDIHWIDAARGDGHLRQRLVESAHTRLLVCDGGLDHLLGVVQSRDLLAALIAGSPLDLAAQLRQPLRLAEASSALEALQQLRRHPIPLAVVVDGRQCITGLVTANDLLAAIAGDLADTRDTEHGNRQQADGSWIVDASQTLDALRRHTGIGLAHDNAQATLSGLFVHRLQRLPAPGDRIDLGDWELEVLDLERQRVGRAHLRPRPGPPD